MLKKILKVLGIICLILLIVAGCVIKFVVNYPEIKNDPTIGKWYRVSDQAMKDSEGNR
jgi:hypothetical protein